MTVTSKTKKRPRFYFWRKTLSLSDLNVPRRSKIAIDALRTLSLIPSFLGFLYNSRQALYVPLRDAGGPLILQSSQVDYVVASIWVIINMSRCYQHINPFSFIVCIGWLLELDIDNKHDETLDLSLRNE
jgi:hypothetical protein